MLTRIEPNEAEIIASIPALAALHDRYGSARAGLSGAAQAIALAREQYPSDDLAIDDEPTINRGATGTWVQAWVWVEDRVDWAAAEAAKHGVLFDRDAFWDGEQPFYFLDGERRLYFESIPEAVANIRSAGAPEHV